MHRTLLMLTFVFLTTNVFAEELVLKDGTKIVGKMTAISGDRIELETAYGKMQVNRADIVTINFPENGPDAAKSREPGKKDLPQLDESLDGTRYLNKTHKFTLTVPANWKINPSLRLSADVVAGLSSQDDLRYLMVVEEDYSGSLDSYKGLVAIQAKNNLDNYEKLSESSVVIDGKPSLLLSYRGVSRAANNLPIQFLVAIIPSTTGYSRISAWCVEPLFDETQGAIEKILKSYHVSEASTTAHGSSKN
jgi:hypothetical protein